MAITASAANVAFTENFEGATYTEWTDINTARYTQAISTGASATSTSAENKYLQISAVGNGNNGSNQMLNASTAVPNGTSDFVMEFDARITNGSGQASHFYVASNSSSYGNYVYSNYVLKFGATAGGANTTTYKVNDNNDDKVTISKNVWNHYRVEVVDGHEYLTITGSDQTPRYEVKTLGTIDKGCKGLAYCTQRYYSAFAVDNVTLKTLSMPTLALSSNTAIVQAGGSDTVNGTVTLGTATDSVVTTATSSNSDVAVEVIDGTTTSPAIKITNNGDADTTATVTVTTATTGNNADAAEVTNQTISVIGGVSTADVTVTYKDAAGNVLKTADTIHDQTVGFTYSATAEQLSAIDPFIKDGIYYYCSLSQSSPTSVQVADGGSTLALVFDKTEYTYDATVNTVYHASVNFNGTSTSGQSVNTTVYSNYSNAAGTATASLPVGTYTVTVTKGGYTFNQGSITVTRDGANSTNVAGSLNSGYLFYEDFNTTGLEYGNHGMFGILRCPAAGEAQTVNTSGSIDLTVPFVNTCSTGTKITLDDLMTNAGNRNRTSNIIFNDTNGNAVLTLNLKGSDSTLTAIGSNSSENTALLTSSALSQADDLVISFVGDKAYGVFTGGKYDTNSFELSVSSVEIASVRITYSNTDTYQYFRFSGIYAEPIIPPSSKFTSHNWIATEGSGYTANGNVLTNSYGKEMYAYEATLTGNGSTYTTIKADLKATDNTTGAPEWTQNVSGSGSFTIYLITNKTLNLTDSVVYCE